eukprot:gene11349-23756_t
MGMTVAWFPSEYPRYCSKDMTKKEIPSLTKSQKLLVKRIEQVQVFVRHGARTPYAKFSCWNGYNIKWSFCNISELMQEYYTKQESSWSSSNLLFRKVYDTSSNALGGTCQQGQLLDEAFQQDLHLGKILKKAYIDVNQTNFKLFPNNNMNEIDENAIFFRSDDETRTLTSGQLVFQNIFQATTSKIIKCHTGDYSLDEIYPNFKVCPRILQLEDEVNQQLFQDNQRKIELNTQINDIFGIGQWNWNTMLDCLMTTICTDHHIPDVSPDGTGKLHMSEGLFNDILNEIENSFANLLLYNNSEWSKLSMRAVTSDISSRIKNIIFPYTKDLYLKTSPKFILNSGHDTTIMPLLAILLGDSWDKQWAPYAALLTIELYEAQSPGNHLFRIVYDGIPLLIRGCNSVLCDVSVLLNLLAYDHDITDCNVVIPTMRANLNSPLETTNLKENSNLKTNTTTISHLNISS